MAKVKLGAIVVDMRGKLGGHVFAQNKGGNYVRTKTTPSNPQTVKQSEVRVLFALISSGWSALSQSGRDSFNALVSAYAKTNVFGDLKNPSGKALYQRLNQNLGLTGQTLLTSCVNPTILNGQNDISVDAVVFDQTMTIESGSNAVGMRVLIYGTAPQTAGTSFVKNKLRLLGHYEGVDSDFIDFGSRYVSRFGAFTLTDNIFIGVRTVNSNGQATPMEIHKARVVAT